MISGKAILPGTLGEHYNLCGKKQCRCNDKVNPQQHGPYYQLSYNLKGKNSSISIKPSEVNIIRKMTDNYREQVSNTQDLGLELLELYKNEGYQSMLDKYENMLSKELNKKTETPTESPSLSKIKSSQGKWKSKALKRQSDIVKLQVKIKNTIEGRDNWKEKYQQQKAENKIVKQEVITLKKELQERGKTISEQEQKKL